jgi:hypothetical protein
MDATELEQGILDAHAEGYTSFLLRSLCKRSLLRASVEWGETFLTRLKGTDCNGHLTGFRFRSGRFCGLSACGRFPSDTGQSSGR